MQLPPLLTAGLRWTLLLSAVGCGGEPPADSSPQTPRQPTFDWGTDGAIADSELGEFHARLACSVDGLDVGELTFTFWPDTAPRTVRRFLRLCDEGWYDGLRFHRIARDFMIQGGDRAGNGAGRGPYGELPRETSRQPGREHHYGVISMAEPPAMQFFVCCADSPQVWALDRVGHNAFGKLVDGVQTLELIASMEVGFTSGGEKSVPLGDPRIVRATVERGPPPRTQPIVRPRPDLHGQPEFVTMQHILITFLERGQLKGVTRNRVEAEILARELYLKLRAGDLDFVEAMREYSDELVRDDLEMPGLWRISNYGVVDVERQRVRQDTQLEMQEYQSALRRRLGAGEIDTEELQRLQNEKLIELDERIRRLAVDRRENVNAPGYADVAFELEVGEVGLVPFDAFRSPGGWYVVRRVE